MPLSGLENLGRRRVLCGRVALVIVCKIPDVCLVLAGVLGRVLVTGSMCRRRYTSFVNILAREVIGESNLEIDYQSRRHSTCHIQKMLTHAWLNNSVLIQGIRRLLGFGIPDEGRA